MKERQTWEEQLKVTEDIIRYFELLESYERELKELEEKLKESYDEQYSEIIESHIEEIQQKRKALHDRIPNSGAMHFLKGLLQGERIKENKKVTISPLNLMTGEQEINYKSPSTELQITIEDNNRIGLKQDDNSLKIFNYMATKANDQGKKERITFYLSELVERGIYKTEHSAYKGVKLCFDKLMRMRITGTQQTGHGKKKKEIRVFKKQILIGYDIHEGGISCFEMQTEIQEYFFNYYNLLPKWTYKLPNKAYALCDYFFYIAYQRKDQITRNGKFSISYDSIRQTIGAPSPKDERRHKEKIIDPIEKALDEIEMIQPYAIDPDTIIYFIRIDPDGMKVNEYLAQNLEIIIDKYTQNDIKKRNTIKQNKTRKTRQSQKRAEHQAKVKAITNRIETGEKIFKEKADV